MLPVGLVGCGHAAEMHLRAIRSLPRLRVEAVTDVDAGARRRLAAAADGAAATATLAELLALPVRAVAVLTPPAAHFEIAMAALEAGKDVVLERPTTRDPEQAARLAARAAVAGRTVAAAYQLRFHRHVAAMRRMLEAGALGRVQLVRTTIASTHDGGRRLPAYRLSRDAGGGALLDLGVAHFDLWRFLLGEEVAEVTAFSRADGGDDVTAGVLARTASGAVAASVFSHRAAEQHAIEVLGERGRVRASLYRADGFRFAPAGSFAGGASRRVRDALAPLAALPAALAARRLGGVYLESYRGLWDAVARTLLDGVPGAPTLDDGTRSLAIALAAIQSADEGRAVRIAPPAAGG